MTDDFDGLFDLESMQEILNSTIEEPQKIAAPKAVEWAEFFGEINTENSLYIGRLQALAEKKSQPPQVVNPTATESQLMYIKELAKLAEKAPPRKQYVSDQVQNQQIHRLVEQANKSKKN